MADAQKELQTKITESLQGLFDDVITKQKAHYASNPGKKPTRRDVEAIITLAANKNALVAGAANLIPGPLGMLAAVPEIVMVLRNQTKMIYDLGLAHGQERFMRAELVMGIVASGVGNGTASLVIVQGGKLLVRRASLRVMQKIVAMLGGQITQRVLKSMVGKWIPVVGAAAMAAWARYTTKQLGERAIEMLSLPIVDLDDASDDVGLVPEPLEVPSPAGSPTGSGAPASFAIAPSASARPDDDQDARIERARIQVLVNLMVADGEAHPDEVAMIESLVRGSTVGAEECQRYLGDLATGKRVAVDFSVFANSPDDRMGLLFAMAGLAMRDGKLHVAERLYLKQVGQQLGFSEADVDAALGAEPASKDAVPGARNRQAMVVIVGVIAFVLVAAAAWSVTRGDRELAATPIPATRNH